MSKNKIFQMNKKGVFQKNEIMISVLLHSICKEFFLFKNFPGSVHNYSEVLLGTKLGFTHPCREKSTY